MRFGGSEAGGEAAALVRGNHSSPEVGGRETSMSREVRVLVACGGGGGGGGRTAAVPHVSG